LKILLLCLALVQDPKDAGKGTDMDYGPFFSSTVSRTKSEKDADILAFKGLTIKVGKDAAVCYDTDLLRMAGAWTGGFLDLSFTHMATSKGLFPTRPGAPLKFATKVGPGWGKGDDFKDPRPQNRGPLPKDWAQYKGLFVDGDNVVLGDGVPADDPSVQRAVAWLKQHQNADGGWGETCESYMRPELAGRGPSIPSQTAWALLALFAAGTKSGPAVQAGIDYLLRTQQPDGAWEDPICYGMVRQG
jgi:hypothetical protein